MRKYFTLLLSLLVAPLCAVAQTPAAAQAVYVNSLQDWQKLFGVMSERGLEQVWLDLTGEGVEALMEHRQALVASNLIRAYQVIQCQNGWLMQLEFMSDAARVRELALDPDLSQHSDDVILQAARCLLDECTTPEMTPRERALAIHDAVVKLCSYNDAPASPRQNAQAALLEPHCTTCEGYSMAYLLLCRMSGIPCLWVGGAAMPIEGKWVEHGWNLIQLDGAWYHVDTTFDDPKLPDGQSTCSQSYFAKTDEEMMPNHRWDRAVYPATPTAPQP